VGRPALILAALAADAAPGKNFRGQQKLDLANGMDALRLRDQNGDYYLFKIPSSGEAESELALDRTVLRAMAEVDDSLPFETPKELGSTRDQNGTLGALFTEVQGNDPDLTRLAPGAFSKTLADALTAIHNLPLTVVRDAGLPEYDSTAQLHNKVAELDTIAGLGRIPADLLTRWEEALEDVGLFRYHPVVVHGSISKDSIRVDGQRVVGITGFSGLKISDPAEDLSWIVGGGLGSTVEDTLLHYRANRPGADENLLQRATLYSELELGSWLVYCVESGDQEAIAQAEDLISDLREQLEAGTLRKLQAASFAGLVSGGMLLQTTELTQVAEVSSAAEPEDEPEAEPESEPDFFEEFAAEQETEIEESGQKNSEPNPDELF
jgi:macrolide phosphotransferase